ncbi:MAG: phosphatidate cytidylyltransferase [Rhodoferax sp.]
MYQSLKQLTPDQQVGAMFVIVFGLLLLASLAVFLASLRDEEDPFLQAAQRDRVDDWRALLRTSWIMVFVFWLAWHAGDIARLLLFASGSFFALREFLTLSPTRRADHRSLVMVFFGVLPLQYVLVGLGNDDLFTVFIPVYVFLALPVASALSNDPTRFLERSAKLQWGIMVCIYGMSHVPALLLLRFPDYDQRNAFLVLFLVLVVQTCMVTQHLVARRGGREPVVPQISRSFEWNSWSWGMAAGSLLGALLAGITPFVPGQAFALSFVACAAGSLGHLVMKALKRDRGIPIWDGQTRAVTGAGGMLDRIDSLCFAAPAFFHSVRWYFDL